MTEQEVRDETILYTNSFGLVDGSKQTPGIIGNSGNSILFHAHYVWLMRRRGFWRTSDMESTGRGVIRCEEKPGLINRAPHGANFVQDQEGPDDQIGYLSMSAADPRLAFADRWLKYGRGTSVPIRQYLELTKHPWLARLFGWIRLHWVFNNKCPDTLIEWAKVADNDTGGVWEARPNIDAWMGRFPQVIAHAQFAANERPWIFRRLWWALSVWQTARFWDKEGTDQWILTWHLVETFRASGQKSWLCERAARNYKERLFTKFPGGLNSVFLSYFGSDHPITKYFLS